MSVSFAATKEESILIGAIVRRYVAIAKEQGQKLPDAVSLAMDITACHANGCPLELETLYKFDDFNFVHDVSGIRNTLNRSNGELTNNFLPRCAVPL